MDMFKFSAEILKVVGILYFTNKCKIFLLSKVCEFGSQIYKNWKLVLAFKNFEVTSFALLIRIYLYINMHYTCAIIMQF